LVGCSILNPLTRTIIDCFFRRKMKNQKPFANSQRLNTSFQVQLKYKFLDRALLELSAGHFLYLKNNSKTQPLST